MATADRTQASNFEVCGAAHLGGVGVGFASDGPFRPCCVLTRNPQGQPRPSGRLVRPSSATKSYLRTLPIGRPIKTSMESEFHEPKRNDAVRLQGFVLQGARIKGRKSPASCVVRMARPPQSHGCRPPVERERAGTRSECFPCRSRSDRVSCINCENSEGASRAPGQEVSFRLPVPAAGRRSPRELRGTHRPYSDLLPRLPV